MVDIAMGMHYLAQCGLIHRVSYVVTANVLTMFLLFLWLLGFGST